MFLAKGGWRGVRLRRQEEPDKKRERFYRGETTLARLALLSPLLKVLALARDSALDGARVAVAAGANGVTAATKRIRLERHVKRHCQKEK